MTRVCTELTPTSSRVPWLHVEGGRSASLLSPLSPSSPRSVITLNPRSVVTQSKRRPDRSPASARHRREPDRSLRAAPTIHDGDVTPGQRRAERAKTVSTRPFSASALLQLARSTTALSLTLSPRSCHSTAFPSNYFPLDSALAKKKKQKKN